MCITVLGLIFVLISVSKGESARRGWRSWSIWLWEKFFAVFEGLWMAFFGSLFFWYFPFPSSFSLQLFYCFNLGWFVIFPHQNGGCTSMLLFVYLVAVWGIQHSICILNCLFALYFRCRDIWEVNYYEMELGFLICCLVEHVLFLFVSSYRLKRRLFLMKYVFWINCDHSENITFLVICMRPYADLPSIH